MAAETAAADADDLPKDAEVASSGQIAIEQEPQQLSPKPANDRKPIEEHKVYARGPETIEAGTAATLYSKADPSTVAAPDRDCFHDVDYRTDLRSMVDHVIEIEGPIYFDVLIERIARAHGFQRSGENVQRIIRCGARTSALRWRPRGHLAAKCYAVHEDPVSRGRRPRA